jgi:cytochrome c-type biogenesis protein CcmH
VTLTRVAGPIALVVVIAVALTIGSGVLHRSPASAAERIAALETQVKCPSCEDLSVAVSNAPSAVAVRHQISAFVHEGRSDQEITDYLVAKFGPTILLRPPTSGLTLVLWVVPVVLGVGALVGLGRFALRRGAGA